GVTTSREESQANRKDGQTNYSTTFKTESSRTMSNQPSEGKDARTIREGLRESASNRKSTSDEVSRIVRKRVGNLNDYIEALEMENIALNTELRELKENDSR